MPRLRIPKNVGPYRVRLTSVRTFAVANDRSGKNRIWIPCRDRTHADDICRRLNEGEHGELWI